MVIQTLQRRQRRRLIIFAAVSFLVAVLACKLGISDAISVGVKRAPRCYRGMIDGMARYQQGKIVRWRQWFNPHPGYYSPVTFYTDAVNDWPLRHWVYQVDLVNPCPQLAKQGPHRGWTILCWRQQSPGYPLPQV